MEREKNDFSRGSVARCILSMAIPMTLAQLVNILYSVVDRIYIGRIPGTGQLELAGLGLALPVISILIGFANLCGMGGGPLCSIYRGRGDREEAGFVVGNSFVILMVFGVILPLIFLPLCKPMLYFFGAGETTYAAARDYLSIYLLGTPFVMISLGMNSMINAQGFGNKGMLTVLLGAAVNLILDPIFIYGFGMGIRGAALATVIAQAASAAWVLAFFMGKQAIIPLRIKYMKLMGKRVARILSLGLSGFFMSLTNSLVSVVCNKMLSLTGGDLYVSVLTVINSVREVSFLAVQGLNNGAQPVIGYNFGARCYTRVRKCIRFTVSVTLVYASLVFLATMLIPGTLIRLFNGDPAMLEAGVPAMRIYFCMFIIMSLQMSGQSVFVSLGHSRKAVFFSLLRKAIINAPLTVILALAMGTDGVFAAEAISQLVGGLACSAAMYFTVYRPLRRQRDGEAYLNYKKEGKAKNIS